MLQSLLQKICNDYGIKEPSVQILKDDLLSKKKVELSMLRLDEVHPFISGNKFYKLIYFLEEAVNSSHKKIITFGGAYSNHLAATAFACKTAGLESIGIVRGEKPDSLSPTLLFCQQQGMHLEFISRADFKQINEKEFLFSLEKRWGKHTFISEGGFSAKGADGASLITQYFKKNFTHICLAIGTATTFAGIINAAEKSENVLGFSVLKGLNDIEERLKYLSVKRSDYTIMPDYHFGGYAKKNDELIQFMNQFFLTHSIPLDFVYTGKMMWGVYDLLAKSYFAEGSKILCIHTGGLQGNQSLAKGTLIYS